MLPFQLIDTPRRNALAAHSITLRTKLKDWEKSFTASHLGQKPGKEDIKACLDIAKTYKEYYKVRDVLAGKLGVEGLDDASAQSPTARKRGRQKHDAGGHSCDINGRGEAVRVSAPREGEDTPHQRQSPPHPNLLDPYDPPTSASPRPYQVTAIGPTPQRDGKVLGLFDLLSNSGTSSQVTPSARKRKVDNIADIVQQDAGIGNEQLAAQTPSQKRVRSGDAGGDILNHLSGDIPKGCQRHSRTPASDGKKFMLSQFFATPSTMRFAAIAEDGDECHHGQAKDQGVRTPQTPLRTHVMGDRTNGATEIALDATPAYLKRSYTFTDRLLSVSASAIWTTNTQKTNISRPTSTQSGPPTLRRYKSGPKPLSEIVRGLRKMDDERHDDDLDALREIESGRINVLVGDSQAVEVGAGAVEGGMGQEVTGGDENEAPRKVWKKKGQKRTTKRANMKPVKMRPKKENQWVAEDSESEDGDRPEEIEETQHVNQQTTIALENREDNFLGSDPPTAMGREVQYMDGATGLDKPSESASGAHFKDKSNHNGLDDCEAPTQSKAGSKRIRNDDLEVEATKSTKKKGKDKDKDTSEKENRKKGPTINPNAVSHQNFRSLKIRNKNSKAKGGRGRFARRGR
jgi:hypothetical protein